MLCLSSFFGDSYVANNRYGIVGNACEEDLFCSSNVTHRLLYLPPSEKGGVWQKANPTARHLSALLTRALSGIRLGDRNQHTFQIVNTVDRNGIVGSGVGTRRVACGDMSNTTYLCGRFPANGFHDQRLEISSAARSAYL